MRPSVKKIRLLLGNAAYRDAVWLGLAGFVFWLVAIAFDAHDSMHDFILTHEHWELDEIILAIAAMGIAGFIYGYRRIVDLNKEIGLRDTAEDKVAWIANHDSLTSLPNRHFLESNYKSRNAHGRSALTPEMVASVDLDGFKQVNDLLGHSAGDELLVATAERLKSAVGDGLVVRMGGDEFVLLIHTAPKNPVSFGNLVIRKLSEPLVINGVQVKISGSVGLAVAGRARDLDTVVREADMAMYVAKRSGRNAVAVFTPDMEQGFLRRAECELELRRAIKKNRIVPHYQPLIDLGTGKTCGFEALARWTDKFGPGYTPDVYIPLAEDLGLIVELSEQILRRACLDAKKWPRDLDLSFNISPTQLTDRLLGLRIVQILGETEFPPQRLQIEITESAIAKDSDTAFRIISDLRASGIRVVLDDFGTGYSSLAQLSRFEFDGIKIDREFIASFLNDEKQMKIIRAIICLAKGLNAKTTAEGVETDSQVFALRKIGCDIVQGYFFAKAMPASEVQGYLADNTFDPKANQESA
ncbi:MAG: EAL domain-containing protein [Tepidamorphaceae bacterium]|nr:EAL domain-containing protein [Rhodobiaceae bacterium]MCC0048979.1 EAL domain-containing protein [Rhodobiaceae bacterium]